MGFTIKKDEYFNKAGVDIMAFSDFYPAGHQSGVSIIMNGNRVAANGDIRFEQTPGQWQPVPKQLERVVDKENNTISTKLRYPDMDAHLHGFNPIIYPDFEFEYEVIVSGKEDLVDITVNLDRPVAPEFAGKLCFNLELFPGALFGKSYIMDGKGGIFPRQANAPTIKTKSNYEHTGKLKPIKEAHADREKLAGYGKGYNPIVADDIIALPYATGHSLTIRPDDKLNRYTITSEGAQIKLYDGRMNHNNGWFVASSEIPEGVTNNAIHWTITPHVDEEWRYAPVIQVSQVGYHPDQPKRAVIELDSRSYESNSYAYGTLEVVLRKLTTEGFEDVAVLEQKRWGEFLRYGYLTCDFSDVKEEGLYQIVFGEFESTIFRIDSEIYERGVWQPVLEYFLPVQMCHMRVNEKYRVWHGRCHHDDARMAPVNYEQFDGAAQGPETMTPFKSGEHVPGLNAGGWHDAGDFDLRIETQTTEMYLLAACYEEFGAFLDETTIDQVNQITEIHEPDGDNDFLQQLEHGALSVVGAYRSLGRLYHEIMCGDLRQYVLLGDASVMTSGIPGGEDERLVFTEDNSARELEVAGHLAGSYRALKDYNKDLADGCLQAAKELYEVTTKSSGSCVQNAYDPLEHTRNYTDNNRIFAACELFLSTGDDEYRDFILSKCAHICDNISEIGWAVCRCIHQIDDKAFTGAVREALLRYRLEIAKKSEETPYGIPYEPRIWGAGWDIQNKGTRYYFLHKAFPELFEPDFMYDSLNFVLGCHPGSNTASFASGVGTKSNLTAYGANRADYSFIPGGVSSGTALIRPDLPELLEFPYLWQQGEYVVGAGSSDYLFLVLAVRQSLGLKF